MSQGRTANRLARATIVGVVPDMHRHSVRRDHAAPLPCARRRQTLNQLSVDVEPGRMQEVHAAVAAVCRRPVPPVPIRTAFVDEDIAALHDAGSLLLQSRWPSGFRMTTGVPG
jgi:hypothetical protein